MAQPLILSPHKGNKSRKLHGAKKYGKGIWATCEIYIPAPYGRKNGDGSRTKQLNDKLEFLRRLKRYVDRKVELNRGETRWYNGK